MPFVLKEKGKKMARLIDADALTDRLDAIAYHDWNQGTSVSWADAFKVFAEMVRDERTVDIEPVKHGHWIEDEARIRDQCSVCGLSVNWSQYKTPYCPLCGAKMDEVEHDT